MKNLIPALLFAVSANFAKAQWQPANTPNPSSDIHAIAVINSSVIISGGRIALSTDDCATWSKVSDGSLGYYNPLVVNGTNVFAGTTNNGVLVSTDNGANWTTLNNGLANANITALAFNGTTIFAGSDTSGLFVSTDNGANWVKSNGLQDKSIYALAVKGNLIFAGTLLGGIFLSNNNGSSWVASNNGLTGLNILSIAVSGTTIFAGTMDGIFISTDDGTSWKAANNGLTGMYKYTRTLLVSGTTVFAGMDEGDGVFFSKDYGANWVPFNTGLAAQHIYTIGANATTIFAGTKGGYLWRRPLSEIAGIKDYNPYANTKIYPNPTSNKVTIINSDATSKETMVSVFNSTGQKVLSDKYTNETQLNVSDLEKGIYILKLQRGSEIENRKLVVE